MDNFFVINYVKGIPLSDVFFFIIILYLGSLIYLKFN